MKVSTLPLLAIDVLSVAYHVIEKLDDAAVADPTFYAISFLSIQIVYYRPYVFVEIGIDGARHDLLHELEQA